MKKKKGSIRYISQSLLVLRPFRCLWGARVWNMSLGSLGTAVLSLGKEAGCGIAVAQYNYPPGAQMRTWTRSYREASRHGCFLIQAFLNLLQENHPISRQHPELRYVLLLFSGF